MRTTIAAPQWSFEMISRIDNDVDGDAVIGSAGMAFDENVRKQLKMWG